MTRKEESLHKKIVKKILPYIARRLKREELIADFDDKEFKIPLFEQSEPIRIRPDLVLHLPDGNKVLVEVANSDKAKRFVGELVYPYILEHRKEINAFFMFVLGREHKRKHARSLQQRTMISDIICGNRVHSHVETWSNEKNAYASLRSFIDRLVQKKE